MFNKLKQIKELRTQAKTIQGMLSQEHVETSAAWGKVKVKMSGNQELESVSIDADMMQPAKKSDLEAAVKEAVNDANKKVQRIMAQKVREQGGLDKLGLT